MQQLKDYMIDLESNLTAIEKEKTTQYKEMQLLLTILDRYKSNT